MRLFPLFTAATLIAIFTGCADSPFSANRSPASAAGTGRLACAYSEYGTPTETNLRAEVPEQTVQVDLLREGTIQVHISDDDSDGEKDALYSAKWVPTKTSSGFSHLNGLMFGTYYSSDPGKNSGKTVRLESRGPKIVLVQIGKEGATSTYSCEIPGAYAPNYAPSIENGRLNGW